MLATRLPIVKPSGLYTTKMLDADTGDAAPDSHAGEVEQWAKARSAMLVTLSGIVTPVSRVQPQKAQSPIRMRRFPSVTLEGWCSP